MNTTLDNLIRLYDWKTRRLRRIELVAKKRRAALKLIKGQQQ